MDFLDPSKKKAHNRRLFIGYILVAVAVAMATLILLLTTYGYDIDRKTGQVIQNGLVFVDSEPVSASVYLNGVSQGDTDLKLVIPSGEYKIELQRANYHTWQKTINLEGSNVEQLTYPFLFPLKLVTTDQQLYRNTPKLATVSPDGHWLLVQSASQINAFDQFDITTPQTTQTTINLPAGLLTTTGGVPSLKVVEWASDNRHVLLKHTFKNGQEFIMLDRADSTKSININKILATNPDDINLRGNRYNQLYLYTEKNKTIASADTGSKKVTPLFDKVITYEPHGANTILYVTTDGAGVGEYAIKLWDGKRAYLIHNYPVKGEYELDMASYDNDDYVIISPKTSNQSYIYKNPLALAKKNRLPTPFTRLKVDQLRHVSFSDNGRFIALQSGAHFAVYDIESDRRFSYTLGKGADLNNEALWMDSYRLHLVAGGKTLVFDFDGTNQQTLTSSLKGFNSYFNRDYNAVYNIADSVGAPKRKALIRTELVVK